MTIGTNVCIFHGPTFCGGPCMTCIAEEQAKAPSFDEAAIRADERTKTEARIAAWLGRWLESSVDAGEHMLVRCTLAIAMHRLERGDHNKEDGS